MFCAVVFSLCFKLRVIYYEKIQAEYKMLNKTYYKMRYHLGLDRRKKMQNLFYGNEKEIYLLNKPKSVIKVKKQNDYIITFEYEFVGKSGEINRACPRNFESFSNLIYENLFFIINLK